MLVWSDVTSAEKANMEDDQRLLCLLLLAAYCGTSFRGQPRQGFVNIKHVYDSRSGRLRLDREQWIYLLDTTHLRGVWANSLWRPSQESAYIRPNIVSCVAGLTAKTNSICHAVAAFFKHRVRFCLLPHSRLRAPVFAATSHQLIASF